MSQLIVNREDSIKLKSKDIYRIGPYEIFLNQQIGVGSYSTVYIGRCIDHNISSKYGINKTKRLNGTNIENVVAIKKIIVKGLSFKHQKMITEEINIMQHIKGNPHINIVTCYDIIDDLDTIYIVMEYCDGGDLSKIIGKPMKEESVKYYFSQLISGVKYLDEHKIIHRDIKPKNLLLTNNKQILKICDFGLAKNKMGLSRMYTVCGSPLYMAPEMFKDKSYDDTIDIWSIGIVMYEMLYGSNPLSKIKDYHELESFMMNSSENIVIPPKNIKNINNNISDECMNLLRTLLIKESCNRITLGELYVHKWLYENNVSDRSLHEQDDDDPIDFENDYQNNSDLINSSYNYNSTGSCILLFKLDD